MAKKIERILPCWVSTRRFSFVRHVHLYMSKHVMKILVHCPDDPRSMSLFDSLIGFWVTVQCLEENYMLIRALLETAKQGKSLENSR